MQRLGTLGKRRRQPPAGRRDIRLGEGQTGVARGKLLPLACVQTRGVRRGNAQLPLDLSLACELLRGV